MYPIWYQALMHRFWYAPVSTGMALLFSVRTWGWHHVPEQGGLLVVANHQSFLDPVLVGMAVRRRMMFLARKTLFWHPLLSWLIKSFGAIPIDQEKPTLEGIRTALELLHRQEAVVLFPEGERTPHGQILPLKLGVTLLIRRGQVPVLPVGIAGAYEIWPRHCPLPILCPLWSRRRCQQMATQPLATRSVPSPEQPNQPNRRGIAVVVGQPIPFAEFKDRSGDAILERLSQVLLDLYQQAKSRRFLCTD